MKKWFDSIKKYFQKSIDFKNPKNIFAPHWQEFDKLFSLTVLKILVLWFAVFPIIAKLFEELGGEITFFSGEISFTFSLGIPFRLEILWVSSLTYFLAYVFYHFRCPKFIKDYPSYTNYEALNHSPRWVVWITYYALNEKWFDDNLKEKLKRRLVEKERAVEISNYKGNSPYIPKPSPQGTSFVFNYGDKQFWLNHGELISDCEDITKDIFWEVFAVYAVSKTKSRFFTTTLLWGSLILFSLVVILNVVAGFRYFL